MRRRRGLPVPGRALMLGGVLSVVVVLWLVVPGPWPFASGLVPRVLGHYFWGVEGTLFRRAPDQPIAFSHARHAGDLGMDCTFCHRTVDKEAMASIPAIEQCMFCHKIIGTGNADVEKMREMFDQQTAIDWVRVHRLPDHVQFVHEPHIRFLTQEQPDQPLEAICATCHGDVKTMTKVRQVRSLKMGDCVDCHRDKKVTTDCVACHY